MKTIYFDMDGTLADFYSVDHWLENLADENPRPYLVAKPLFDFRYFARLVRQLQSRGYRVGIISWLSKQSTPEYDILTTAAKQKWLSTHLKSISFDEVHIIPYGTPKSSVAMDIEGILFDDEERNRVEWKGTAFNVENIIEVLKNLE